MPIGKLGRLGKSLLKENRGQVTKSGLFDFERLGEAGQVFESGRFEIIDLLEVDEVVLDCDTRFDDFRIFENLDQRTEFMKWIKAKEKGLIRGGQLDQSRRVVGAALEVRFAFDVKAEDSLLA